MERTLTIDGRQVSFKSTGAFLLRYKAQFGRDAIKDILKVVAAFDEEKQEIVNIELVDLEVFYNLIWTLAKTADPSISDPVTWLDTFDEFPLMDIIPEIQDLITSSLKSTKKK
jgi:hypothetical protein